MSLSLRALATRTSWPHSSSTLLAHGEWVPASMAMRIGGCSEAKRRLRVSGVVRSLPSSMTSPLCWSIRHRYEYLSPRSNPAVVFGSSLLPSMVGRSSFHIGRFRARRTLADPKGTAHLGGRPSHLIFSERRLGEVRRIALPKPFGNSRRLLDRASLVPRSDRSVSLRPLVAAFGTPISGPITNFQIVSPRTRMNKPSWSTRCTTFNIFERRQRCFSARPG